MDRTTETRTSPTSPTEALSAAALSRWVHECARMVAEQSEHLSELDAATGDADHGSNLSRGFAAVVATLAAEPTEDPAELLKTVGMTLVDVIGGSSGALYGTFFLRMALTVRDAGGLDAALLARAVGAGAAGVAERGRVRVGDKTMYDALAPAAQVLQDRVAAGADLATALAAAAAAAEDARDATAAMRARKGRASYLGDRSVGHLDAGASSMALVVRAAAGTLGGRPQ